MIAALLQPKEQFNPPETPAPLAIGDRPKASAGAFTSGDRTSQDLACWKPSLQSADLDILPDKWLTQARAHDLVRNNGFAAGAVNAAKDRIVGNYYRLNLTPNYRALKIDATAAKDWAHEVEALFHSWADDPECWIDASRQRTFTDILRSVVYSDRVCGEAFLSREWRGNGGGTSTCFQLIEPERISNPSGIAEGLTLKNGNQLRSGVELDRWGAAVAYHVRTTHFADVDSPYGAGYPGLFMPLGGMSGINDTRGVWDRVTKYNRFQWLQIIHLQDADRANQTRGISPFHSITAKLKQMDRQEGATLEAAILSATLAIAIESEYGPESAYKAIGAIGGGGDALKDYLGARISFGGATPLKMDGVKIPHLFPGEKLVMHQPQHPAPTFEAFEAAMLRHVARGLNVSYEQLSGDYTRTTYSSARASMQEAWAFTLSKRASCVDRAASLMFGLWADEQAVKGLLPPLPTGADYWRDRALLLDANWIGQGKGHIDELKAAHANAVRISSGETTLQSVCAQNGEDWEDVLEQRAVELQRMRDLDIPLPLLFDPAAVVTANANPEQPQ